MIIRTKNERLIERVKKLAKLVVFDENMIGEIIIRTGLRKNIEGEIVPLWDRRRSND